MSHVRHPTEMQQALAARGDAVDLLERLARRPVRPLSLARSAAAPPLPQVALPQPVAPLGRAHALPPQHQAGGVGPQRQIRLVEIVTVLAIVAIASVAWAAPRGTAPAPQAPTTAVPGISGAAVPRGAAQHGTAVPVVPSGDFRYDAPPSISRDDYIAIYCLIDSPACPEAGAMYDILATADQEGVIDPAVEAAQGMHETGLGTNPKGVGRLPTLRADGSVDPCCGGRNLHGVQCFPGDARIADLAVDWGSNGCAGVYPDYATSVRTWKGVILREYVAEGKDTPAKAVWKYAPVGKDGNNPPTYIADMESWIACWRAKSPSTCFEERGIAVRQ